MFAGKKLTLLDPSSTTYWNVKREESDVARFAKGRSIEESDLSVSTFYELLEIENGRCRRPRGV